MAGRLLLQLLPLRLRLLQPVRHAHVAVHGRRGGEVFLRLLPLARAPRELGEAEVAVSNKRAHTAWLGEFQSPVIVVRGDGRLRLMAVRDYVSEDPKRVSLLPSFTELRCNGKCALSRRQRFFNCVCSLERLGAQREPLVPKVFAELLHRGEEHRLHGGVDCCKPGVPDRTAAVEVHVEDLGRYCLSLAPEGVV